MPMSPDLIAYFYYSGALELMDIKCVDNLMKFLDESKANGWKVCMLSYL